MIASQRAAQVPAVSVVMPLRDGAPHLHECIDSVRQQSMPDFELLVIDDGSIDEGPSIVAQHAREDGRIRLHRQAPLGIVAALNRGLQAARSDLVARMDADDVMHPRRLELQLAAMRDRPALTVLASRVEAFPADAISRGMREYLRWQNACLSEQQLRDQIFVESVFTHPSTMYRRERILALGAYRDGTFPEDYDLWLRVAAAGDAMHKLDACLLRWRQHATSASRLDARYARTAFDALRALHLARDPRLHASRKLVIWGAGRRTRMRCRRLLQRGLEVHTWIDIDPRKVGQRIAGVPVCGPAWLATHARDRAPPFVLVYVANHGAREAIAIDLQRMGYRCGSDFLAVG